MTDTSQTPYPLTSPQREIWFDQILHEEVPLYNIGGYVKMPGVINPVLFEQAINLLVQKHDTLRTILLDDIDEDGIPLQSYASQLTVSVPVQDFSTQAQPYLAAITWMQQRFVQPFELKGQPLFRYDLIKISNDCYYWLLQYHHLIIDGYGVALINRSLAEIYTKLAQGQQPVLNSPSYVNFIENDGAYIESPLFEKQRQYWLDKFPTPPDLLFTPRYRSNYTDKLIGSGCEVLYLPRDFYNRLHKLAKQHDATLFHVLLGALYVYFTRIAGRDDFAIGFPTHNRTQAKFKETAGLFTLVNPTVFDFGKTLSFAQLLQKIHGTVKEDICHQPFPISKINRNISQDINQHSLLFDISLFYQDFNDDFRFNKIDGQMTWLLHAWEQTPLVIYVQDFHAQLEVKFDFAFNLAYFNTEDIKALQARFVTILETVLKDSLSPIHTLPVMIDEERKQLIAWNDTATDYLSDKTIVDLFEEQVEKTPANIAVVFKEQQLTYQQLNEQANQLAHYLLDLKNQAQMPDNPLMAIAVERSVEMVIGLLGILKASGAYVPIDPSYPAARIQYMLEDSKAPVLLTQSFMQAQLPMLTHDCVTVCLDDGELANQPSVNPFIKRQTTDLAYVIYTSGSTGMPKGVMIEHQSLVNLSDWHVNAFSIQSTDKATLLANNAFDASVWELWPYLIKGACVIPAQLDLLLQKGLWQWFNDQDISISFLPTPIIDNYSLTSPPTMRHLRYLLTGGDKLHHCPNTLPCPLVNNYGPTENTVVTSSAVVKPDELPSIGKPIANIRIYILDTQLNPQPPDIPGELCIAGHGLARGYLNRPELTAEKFIEVEIFGKTERIYKTGDLARWLPDGNLEYLGRIDHQVKLRGFRIELGEIESVLAQHNAIEQSVVTSHTTAHSHDKRLIAYIVPTPDYEIITEGESSHDFVNQWQTLYDSTYEQTTAETDLTFNITGWANSYTGENIPAEEMHVWLETTVAAIETLNPREVLEIGCGSGLLLSRIAPHSETYWGFDFSEIVIRQVEQLKQNVPELSHVVLESRTANNFGGIQTGQFDTIILNSVIQHFPSVDYLINVLEQAIDVIKPGGHLFVGDVRHLALLRTFHTSVQFYQAFEKTSQTALRQRVAQQQLNDKELVINPHLFIALYQQHPRVTGVKIRPHRGIAHNELTRFRYQVILEIEHPEKPSITVDWQDWQPDLTLERLRQQLEAKPAILGLRNVANARLESETAIVAWLDNSAAIEKNVGELRQTLATIPFNGIEPEVLWQLGEELGYRVDFGWQTATTEGNYDVLFKRLDDEAAPNFPIPTVPFKNWRDYANNPLQRQLGEKLIPQLRDYLNQKLPDYMVPSAFVVLDKLPLTPNGKIDRKALPNPESVAQSSLSEYVAPRNVTEEKLAQIWTSVLGLEQVGIHDNFFKLGGHSLLATQLSARIRDIFQVELPVRAVFEHSQLSLLALTIESANCEVHLPPISKQPADSPPVLSFAQQRLWFLYQFQDQSSSTYNVPTTLRLDGYLNITALQQSLFWLLERHHSLRCVFPTQDGQAQVLVLALENWPVLTIHDLTGLKVSAQEPAVQNRANHHAIEPFDLENGPLFKAELFTLSARKAVLLLNMHHIISDGWSMGVFIRDWQHAYTAFAQGERPSLPPLEIQYSDYAAWQRDWLQGRVLQQQTDYWRSQLAGAPELLELPIDKPRPRKQSYQGAHYSQPLSPVLSEAINSLSRSQGVSLFMTLLSTFEILLSRYSRQSDVCVGSPIANRTHSQSENLIGFFVNTLVLRAELQPDLSVIDLLKANRQTCLEAYAHQDIPFEMLVEQLQPTRSLSHSPLFQVMLVLQNNDFTDLTLPGLEITALAPDYPISKFDLTLSVKEQDEQLHCIWEYATDLFYLDTIERMAGHFEVLLNAIIDNPTQSVSQLPMLTPQEVQQLLAWNDTATATDYPVDKTIVDLFEEQVEKTPSNIAVVFEEQQLSYRQLNEQANRLAHYLLEIKNQASLPDNSLIAIAVERSIEMVIGLLGILKAGGAYVPIDPSYPSERIQYMLEESRTPVLLTQSHLKTQRSVLAHDCVIVCLDEGAFANQPIVNPTIKRFSTDLAYVIYTSGSTGGPKGVMLEHAGAVNLARFQQHYFHTNTDSKILQFASLSFDAATWEVLMSLCSGGRLQLAPMEIIHSDLKSILQKQAITHATLPPSVVNVLSNSDLPELKYLVVAGEACSSELVKQWAQRGKHFINAYGPTEATVCASVFECLPDGKTPPIGKPISNTRIYILDTQHQLQPPNIPGELCIAGRGLARGYLNRPELTAEKFIYVKIFGKTERIYKTGDLARWRFDGNLEYLGRIDHQVKLRGFRIELGEIEAVLSQHEFVKDAVVILYEADENKRLVAYLTIAVHDGVSVVKDWLRARLPDYMIPSQFMVLEQLPLTPNGKIDRQALPTPSIETTTETQLLTPTEDLLANLWAEVLKLKTVSRNDNFFELGGHSLLATQLIARIRDAFQVELPVRVVFEEPKLSQLATKIEEATREIKLPPISTQSASSKKVLSFAQQRLWFLNQFEDQQQSTYNMPVALRLEGDLDINALQQSLSWLIERHDSLRYTFPTKDGQAQLQISPKDQIEVLKIHDFTELSTERQWVEVQNRANSNAIEPFDLSQGPLFKADLFTLSATESVFLLNMHHIISDGWSMGVFSREWQHAYTAFTQGEQPSLPPLSIQYSDYAAWQRDWLQGELLQQQVDYWRSQLAGAPELLELPTDKPRPAQQSYQGAHYSQFLSPTLSEAVKRLSREQGVTLFMTLLTTFDILLSRYSGQSDLCVGSPIANRTHRQTENLIGFFVNTLVLRAQLQPDLSFLELLRANRQTCLEAYAHQDIPFEMLVEQLQPTRSLSHSPLFQVMFTLQNNDTTDLTLPGLEITAIEPDYPISQFDLTLSIDERDDQLHCFWEYATDLFLASTIEWMAKHFEMLLIAILENPEQAISQFPMLTEKEVQQLLDWNDTATDYPLDKTIVDLFEEQVEKTPANIAVVFEQQQLTYQQLNSSTNQLAHYLLALKNQTSLPDNPLIAIAVEPSLDMVIGLLGILKASGAYVPIDPSYPVVRIQYMLEDSQAPVLLTQSHLKAQLPMLTHDCVTVCLDDGEFVHQPTINPSVKRLSTDLAYVIYTSGSTGRPKGVKVEQSALCNLVHSSVDAYSITHNDNILQFASISFDAAAEEIYPTLLIGATLILHTPERLNTTETFLFKCDEQQLTVLDLPTAYWQQLLTDRATINQEWPENIRLVLIGGEAVSGESIKQWLAKFGSFPILMNTYGPTEATVVATRFQFAPNRTNEIFSVPIGKPIANTRIYILDRAHQIQPLGIPGELCIAGHGLARGYLNRPELTAEKFIEVDIEGKTERIYKTGDLARLLPDGNLEYLGRIDHQVKLRGFRIELGEIEAVLTQHEAVTDAVVILYEADENKRLVAYLTESRGQNTEAGNKGSAVLITELRAWLKNRLPDYMVPSQLVVLDQLPKTPNGKIDRKALSKLSVEINSREKWVAPRTHWEKLLAEIWAEVLGLEQVGIHHNFFDLGGHSLQAVQLVSKIASSTKIKVSVKQLFLSPTIAQLAERLEKSVPEPPQIEHNPPVTSQSDNPPILKVSQSSPYFQLERRSLLSQVLSKKMPPVNAAALGYLPDSMLEPTGLNREQMLEQCFENRPVVSSLIETAWGRIALLLLPRFNAELYGDTNDLVEVILEALEIAGQIGATTVSLTGIIPSATDYGRAIVKGMADRRLPQITTGHSTTSATVVLALQKILLAGGRSMPRERVGVIGLGSIGFSSLCLMLKCLPHPAELMLCDLYSKKAFLEKIRERLINELGFQGPIQLLFSEVELPKEIYQATLIIGATNVPDVLDINQVQSGTLIVDDSGPHCFNPAQAIKRFEEHQDILFTEGGVLKSPQPITETLYFPHHWEKKLPILSEYASKYNPVEITGCIFSSVLSCSENLNPTVGLVQLDESVKHFETLRLMGFQAADLHCENYVLPLDAMSHFRERFGHS